MTSAPEEEEEDSSGLDDLLICLGQVCIPPIMQLILAYLLASSGQQPQNALCLGCKPAAAATSIGASADASLAIWGCQEF